MRGFHFMVPKLTQISYIIFAGLIYNPLLFNVVSVFEDKKRNALIKTQSCAPFCQEKTTSSSGQHSSLVPNSDYTDAHLEKADTSEAVTHNEHDPSHAKPMEFQEESNSLVLPNVGFSGTGHRVCLYQTNTQYYYPLPDHYNNW